MRDAVQDIRVEADDAELEIDLSGEWIEDGLREVTLRLRCTSSAASPTRVAVCWGVPLIDIAGRWTPTTASNRSLLPDLSLIHI